MKFLNSKDKLRNFMRAKERESILCSFSHPRQWSPEDSTHLLTENKQTNKQKENKQKEKKNNKQTNKKKKKEKKKLKTKKEKGEKSKNARYIHAHTPHREYTFSETILGAIHILRK